MFAQLQVQGFELPGGLGWGRPRQLDRQGPETLRSRQHPGGCDARVEPPVSVSSVAVTRTMDGAA